MAFSADAWFRIFIEVILYFCNIQRIIGYGLLCLFILSASGKTLGLRYLYVKVLLRLFEFGRVKIERAHRIRQRKSRVEEPDEDELDIPDKYSTPVTENHSPIQQVIDKDVQKDPEAPIVPELPEKDYQMSDVMFFIKKGVEAIIDDDVTKRFAAEELASWNLLTRTNKNYQFSSTRLALLWGFGCIVRYCILFPCRVCLTFIGLLFMIVGTTIVGCVPQGRFKRCLYWYVSLITFRILSRAISAIVRYHNRENMAQSGGICVANHTSPIDIAILACDNCYALVGQRQGGFLGLCQWSLSRATHHVWFERTEIKDRQSVVKRLQDHVQDPNKLPILIFPEGTCINNTSVMQFKKGSFEVGGRIYPAAIKYDPRFGDPFWNSLKQNYIMYLSMMMTSWAIVADVWYMPPMEKMEGESSVDFANRVKAKIASQGGLVDLMWDGQLKRTFVKSEFREKQRKEYSQRLKFE